MAEDGHVLRPRTVGPAPTGGAGEAAAGAVEPAVPADPGGPIGAMTPPPEPDGPRPDLLPPLEAIAPELAADTDAGPAPGDAIVDPDPDPGLDADADPDADPDPDPGLDSDPDRDADDADTEAEAADDALAALDDDDAAAANEDVEPAWIGGNVPRTDPGPEPLLDPPPPAAPLLRPIGEVAADAIPRPLAELGPEPLVGPVVDLGPEPLLPMTAPEEPVVGTEPWIPVDPAPADGPATAADEAAADEAADRPAGDGDAAGGDRDADVPTAGDDPEDTEDAQEPEDAEDAREAQEPEDAEDTDDAEDAEDAEDADDTDDGDGDGDAEASSEDTQLAAALWATGRWGARNVAATVVGPAGPLATMGAATRRFPLASVTKLLLAYACLVAVEEGTLALDEPAGPPGATVAHLLAHAAGLGFDTDVVLPPGVKRIYSNTGFDRLAEHLAERAGMDAVAYVTEAVLAPLGMTDTSIPDGSLAHGASSTVVDLGRFAVELLRPTLIHPLTLQAATTPVFPKLDGILPGIGPQSPNDWGLGFELRSEKHPHWTGSTNSPATFGHFGAAGTFLWVDPAIDRALVVLTDRSFGAWALAAWPPLSDAVVAARRAP